MSSALLCSPAVLYAFHQKAIIGKAAGWRDYSPEGIAEFWTHPLAPIALLLKRLLQGNVKLVAWLRKHCHEWWVCCQNHAPEKLKASHFSLYEPDQRAPAFLQGVGVFAADELVALPNFLFAKSSAFPAQNGEAGDELAQEQLNKRRKKGRPVEGGRLWSYKKGENGPYFEWRISSFVIYLGLDPFGNAAKIRQKVAEQFGGEIAELAVKRFQAKRPEIEAVLAQGKEFTEQLELLGDDDLAKASTGGTH